MSTTTAALEIACAKPGCHWKGPPGEAPGHPCPTPAPDATMAEKVEAAAERGAKLPQVESSFLDPLDGDAALVAQREALFAELDGAGVSYDKKTSAEGLRELVALTTGKVIPGSEQADRIADLTPEDEPAIAYDADPTDQEGLETWLTTHGAYDDQGVPQDERTATLDARYSTFADAEPDLEPDPAAPAVLPIPEEEESAPAEEDDEQIAAEASTAGEDDEPELGIGAAAFQTAIPRPWETVIAEALEQQTAVKEYRWLVVFRPAHEFREAELIGRGKIKNEAVVIQEDVQARGQLTGDIVVVKTSDVLQAAAEIEKRREVVDEPGTVVEAPPETVPEPEPAAEPQEEPDGTPAAPDAAISPPPAPPKKPQLFDASDYDREDLALPKVDGHPIDRIAVAFSGEIMLDRSDPDHVQLWRRLLIGKEVELWVTAKGKGVASTGATNREGDLDVIVGKRTVAITTVRILGPEDLEDAAREIAAQARDAAENQDARDRNPKED